jgi:predicted nucleic-acid-binding protein
MRPGAPSRLLSVARTVLNDNPAQSRAARELLKAASLIAVPFPCLCELVWVLRQGAKLAKDDVATAVRSLTNAGNVVVNWPAPELGPAVPEAGEDFADGAIAYERAWLGGEMFVSSIRRPSPCCPGRGEPRNFWAEGRNRRSEAPHTEEIQMDDEGHSLPPVLETAVSTDINQWWANRQRIADTASAPHG